MSGCLGGSVGEASAFGSGHDSWVLESRPMLGFLLSRESASPSPSPLAPPSLVHVLVHTCALPQVNKIFKKNKKSAARSL